MLSTTCMEKQFNNARKYLTGVYEAGNENVYVYVCAYYINIVERIPRINTCSKNDLYSSNVYLLLLLLPWVFSFRNVPCVLGGADSRRFLKLDSNLQAIIFFNTLIKFRSHWQISIMQVYFDLF